MGRPLPPLNAIRAFEAAARHGSFVKAAAELGVTAGAVSQQVRTLETRLGRRLFRRQVRGVALTEAGRSYRAGVSDALDRLAAATDALIGRKERPSLRLTVLPAFAQKWLLPRLPRFHERHPRIDVDVSAEPEVVDFAAADFEIGIRYTDGNHPDLRVDLLFEDGLVPVCGPALLEGPRMLRKPADLAQHVLLHDREWKGDWPRWLAAAGVTGIETAYGPTFTLYSMAVEAAVSGLGVLVGHTALIGEELASGQLVAPFDLLVPAPHAHYLVSPKWVERRPAVRAFRAWILGAARDTRRCSPRGPALRPAGSWPM